MTVASLLLVLATAPACSGPEDPTDDTGNGGEQDTGVTDTGGGDEDTGTPEEDTWTPDEDTGGDTVADDTGGTDGGGDAGDEGGWNPDGPWDPVDECSVQSDFTGEVASDSAEHGGGQPADSNDVLPADAGVGAVWSWMENNPSEAEGGTELSEDQQIEINGAIVVATEAIASGLGNQRFYIQDQNRSLYVRLSEAPTIEDPEADTPQINVGDAVSFTVQGVNLYQGETPQISQTSAITVESSGNQVPIHEVGADSISPDLYNHVVRIGGRLTNGWKCDSDSTDCTSERCNICYDLQDQDGNTIVTFRSQTATQGSDQGFPDQACVTFVGPLGMFPGPLAQDVEDPPEDRLQIQDVNYNDWLFQARNAQ